MNTEARELSHSLARAPWLSDYDFWRALKSLDDELYRRERRRRPIPIDLIFMRVILREARRARRIAGGDPSFCGRS